MIVTPTREHSHSDDEEHEDEFDLEHEAAKEAAEEEDDEEEYGVDLSYRDLRESVDSAQRRASFKTVDDHSKLQLPVTFGLRVGDADNAANASETDAMRKLSHRSNEHQYQRLVIEPSEGTAFQCV